MTAFIFVMLLLAALAGLSGLRRKRRRDIDRAYPPVPPEDSDPRPD